MAERQVVICWDATVICPLAESFVNGAHEEGATAEVAASRKEAKYADLDDRYVLKLFAVESPWRL